MGLLKELSLRLQLTVVSLCQFSLEAHKLSVGLSSVMNVREIIDLAGSELFQVHVSLGSLHVPLLLPLDQ